MIKKSKIKELIKEKGYEVEDFANLVLSKGKFDREILMGYLNSGKIPSVRHQNCFYSFVMALVLGIKVHELFN